jgi:hypothetical protein
MKFRLPQAMKVSTTAKQSLLTLICALTFAGTAANANDQINVVDENNQPVANAKVMLGFEPGNPFPGNVFTTNGSGIADIPADWKAALPITVQADGYIITTIPETQPGQRVIQLTKRELNSDLEVKGTTTDFGRLIRDGKVDFGMVVPALSRKQMLAFDVSSVISPQNDTITIVGNSVNIPSNITLPEQTETYIFPIELNKPDYRVYMRAPGQYRMGVTHGQFPLQRVVGDIRAGKSFLEIVNYFDFKEGGQQTLTVDTNMQVNMPVNQIPFTSTLTVKAPQFAGNLAMLSLAMFEQDGTFLPSDLKRLTPGQSLPLKAPANSPMSVVSLLLENQSATLFDLTSILRTWFAPLFALKGGHAPWDENAAAAEQNFSKLSFTFLPATGGVTPQFLQLVNKPELSGQNMKLSAPALLPGLVASGVYLTLSEIEQIGQEKLKVERRTRLWEIWSDTWISQMEMPKVQFERRKDRLYRWDVLFLARPSNSVLDLNSITHATRNSLDI